MTFKASLDNASSISRILSLSSLVIFLTSPFSKRKPQRFNTASGLHLVNKILS